MSARPFAPIWMTLPDRMPRRIDSAFEALECLIAGWPVPQSLAHRRAVRICRDALDGFASPEAARRAFLAAAEGLEGATLEGVHKQMDLPQPTRLGAAASRHEVRP